MEKLRQADMLQQWTTEHQLSAEQFNQAQQFMALHPDSEDWLRLALQLLLSGAVILAACAVIFFFAHNWPLMHYFSKFALAAVLIAASGVVALCSPLESALRKAALLGCSLLSGALLALIGQVYQTGADIWQLFAAWAALITPLVLLAKSRLCYLLWFSVIELALLRYLDQSALFWFAEAAKGQLLLTAANLLLWAFACFALPKLGVTRVQQLHWLGILALLIPATLGAVAAPWQHGYQLNLLLFAVLALLMLITFFRLRKDLLVVALWLFALVAVSTSLLAKALQSADELIGYNLLALFVIGSTASIATWLRLQMLHAKGAQ